ncbi:Protein saf1 [Lachnellula hyalina]|uniref:Protein saf1 n=1 Tax=Lachnellula hyalina TaxID=1316788 RepID=A0A8H8RB53_9HELO|nr:Protein saf1 [Lachnellula hyalina]TVY30948.1 Protein saf1 [Lachnellula hyalina]
MPKEKSVNPAQAQRKADKAKAIKKGKTEAQGRRNEKLARRNPDRLQKQLDELHAIETSGGKLTSHEKSVLEGLEKDIKAVKRARETLGDAAPKFSSGPRGDREGRGGFGGRGGGVLGKRRRDEGESSEEEVPEDVKAIPMPRDTPPPIPKEVLDKWYRKRREKMGHNNNDEGARARGTNANNTPLGDNARVPNRERTSIVNTPVMEAKTTYEAKPIVRDLRKEAVSFVPAAVRAKLDKSKGVGGLVEPEEADRLEKAGYMKARGLGGRNGSAEIERASEGRSLPPQSREVMMEEVEDEDG